MLPEANTVSVYRFLKDKKPPLPDRSGLGAFFLFDPCSADEDTAAAVRELLLETGVQFTEPPDENRGGCCGYGGGIGIASADLAKKISKKRISQSGLPFLTYCANCRDIFAADGKESLHLLDVLCGTGRRPLERPTVSGRRANRERLKAQLVQKYGGGLPSSTVAKEEKIALSIPPDILARMDSERILEEDVRYTIACCEDSKSVILRESDGMKIGHWKLGSLTYWVLYKETGGCFTLLGVYSHRLVIEDGNHD